MACYHIISLSTSTLISVTCCPFYPTALLLLNGIARAEMKVYSVQGHEITTRAYQILSDPLRSDLAQEARAPNTNVRLKIPTFHRHWLSIQSCYAYYMSMHVLEASRMHNVLCRYANKTSGLLSEHGMKCMSSATHFLLQQSTGKRNTRPIKIQIIPPR